MGFLVLTLEIAALLQNLTFARSMSGHAAWLLIYRRRYLFGIVLGVASTFLWYPSFINGERFMVLGLPFVIMLLDQAGKDYIGFLTFPSFLADMVVWLLIPDLLLWPWARRVAAI
jgi:hypothetical protein